MSEPVTIEFLAHQVGRVLSEQASVRADINVLTSIVLRVDTTLARLVDEVRATREQHQDFDRRVRRLEESVFGGAPR